MGNFFRVDWASVNSSTYYTSALNVTTSTGVLLLKAQFNFAPAHNTMQTYRAEVKLHAFLTSALYTELRSLCYQKKAPPKPNEYEARLDHSRLDVETKVKLRLYGTWATRVA
jgi:hypothetical protein